MADRIVYTVKELSQAFGIGINQAYNLCQREDFPSIRISNQRIVVPVEGLRKWLAENGGYTLQGEAENEARTGA